MRKILAPLFALLAGLGIGFAVIGSAPAAGLEQAFANCLERPDVNTRYECAKGLIESSYPARSAAEVNDAIISATEAGGMRGLEMCHRSSEYLGTYLANLRGAAALDELIYSCLGGTVHGVFYALGHKYDASEIAAMSVGVCERFGAGQPWVVGWDCRHGVGHAISEDPDVSLEDYTSYCDRVYEDVAGREDCGSGVMGGIIERLSLDKEIIGFDPSDPVGWCETLDAPHDRACKQRSGLLARTSGFSDAELTSFCEPRDVNCSYGIGFYFGQATFDYTPQERIDTCATMGDEDRRACIAGVIRAITPDYWLNKSDPGICAVAGTYEGFCREEQDAMRLRELTITQITGAESAAVITGDVGAWPADLRPKR